MTPTPTICEECDHVCSSTRSKEPWHWRCIKAPVSPGYKFLARTWSPDPPYARCSDVNSDGKCEMWSPLRRNDVTREDP